MPVGKSAIVSCGSMARDHAGFPKSHNLKGEWEGYGTALKPAYEPIILARKPFKGSVASNVLEHGTGAMNIDGCRISHDEPEKITERTAPRYSGVTMNNAKRGGNQPTIASAASEGRWPANLLLDQDSARMLDEQSGVLKNGGPNYKGGNRTSMFGNTKVTDPTHHAGDQGGASRFFYTAKSSRAEREAGLDFEKEQTVGDGRKKSIDNPYQRGKTKRKNIHPTLKPIDLMRYLIRLVTPPGGTVLDPFVGSGSTIVAARIEGFNGIGIEKEEQYANIARKRVAYAGVEAGNATEQDAQEIAGEDGKPVQIGLFK